MTNNVENKKFGFGKIHESQRGYFSKSLYDSMLGNDQIYLVLVDLGFSTFDSIIRDFPERVIRSGASEQAAMGIAVGLALSGKIPFIYTITSFFLRCAETISLYIEHEKIPVRMVGAGLLDDYKTDGWSHDGTQAQKFIRMMKFVECLPKNKEQVPDLVKFMVNNNVPSFLGLRR